MKEILDVRKQLLTNTLNETNMNLTYIHLISKLINENKIDNLIYRITNQKTLINPNSNNKKYYDANEQFLVLINNFISYFKNNFYFIDTEFNYIIESLLKNSNPSITKFLLSKNYIGNNDFIDYFNYNLNRLITYNFYKNLKLLSKHSKIINQFFKNKKLNININLINTSDGLNRLLKYLKMLCIANVKNVNHVLLFENINVYITDMQQKRPNTNKEIIYNDVINYFVREWENIINNFLKNEEFIFKFFSH